MIRGAQEIAYVMDDGRTFFVEEDGNDGKRKIR